MMPWVVLIFLQDGSFFVKTKEKLEIQKQPKLIGQTKMSDYKPWVVDTFQKGMNLADVAHELCDQTATVEVYQLEA